MKSLLPTNSPTYLRRLARELNALPDGFYWKGQRWSRARVISSAGADGKDVFLQVSRPGDEENSTHTSGTSNGEGFSDAYGRNVCATRRAP